MGKARKILIGILATVGLMALFAPFVLAMVGASARPAPSPIEARLARAARHLLIPRSARSAANPVERSPQVLDNAMRHWADHCASCHGNDGTGNTSLGRGLYPRAPDMTLPATQELSDGELFWIIENGVKLTGMPAWGDPSPEDDGESWELVHFIRHLDDLTETELKTMEHFNPVSREELEQQLEIERFLAGETSAPPKSETQEDHH